VEDFAGTGSTLFSGRLFWRQLRFGGNWLHIIFWRIVLEADQIWREPQQKKLTQPHNCAGSDLVGTDSTLFSGRMFWSQLRYGGNLNKKIDYCIVH
jgi:hypothetical protein